MIKVLVLNEPTAIIDAQTDIIDFYFEEFDYPICQDFIKTCLKNGKALHIFEPNDDVCSNIEE